MIFENQASISYEYLLTSSKDGLFKIWDINIQECLATVPGLTNEIWSFIYHAESGHVLIGSNSEEIQIIKVQPLFDKNSNNQEVFYFSRFRKITLELSIINKLEN